VGAAALLDLPGRESVGGQHHEQGDLRVSSKNTSSRQLVARSSRRRQQKRTI